MKIFKLKKWSQKNLSPLAWLRIVLEIYPKMEGFTLDELENPEPMAKFSKNQVLLFHETIYKMYGVSFLKSVPKHSS